MLQNTYEIFKKIFNSKLKLVTYFYNNKKIVDLKIFWNFLSIHYQELQYRDNQMQTNSFVYRVCIRNIILCLIEV